MMTRRWKVLFALAALAAIGLSVLAAHACFTLLASAAPAAYPTLFLRLSLCGAAHMAALCLTLFALVLYLCCKRGVKTDLLCAGIFALLVAGAQHLFNLREALGELPLGYALLEVWCVALAPLAFMGMERENARGWRLRRNLTLAASGAAFLLPLFFLSTLPEDARACVTAALAAMAVGLCAAAYGRARSFRSDAAFVSPGFLVGLAAMFGSVIACGVVYLNLGHSGGSLTLGLAIYVVGVWIDVARELLALEERVHGYDELAQREEEYRFSSRHLRMYIIRYQVAARRAIFRPDAALAFGLPQNMDDMPETLIRMGRAVENTVPALRDMYERIQRGERTGSAVFGIYKKNGAVVWLHTDFTTNLDANGEPKDSIISSYEVVGMREKEAAYKRWAQTYADAARDEPCAYYEANLTRDEVLAHGGPLTPPPSLPATLEGLCRALANDLFDAEDREAFLRLCNRDKLLTGYAQDLRHDARECRRRAGDERPWTEVSVRMLADPYSADVLCFLMLRDVEERKRQEARDRVRSQTDELTGLLSRVSFSEQLNELCQSAAAGTCHAVLMIDMDGFKAVNDTFGHRFGDKVLCDIAGDLRAINRSDDLVARLGGDEFILCLKNIPMDTDFLSQRCREICRALSKQYGDSVAVSGSVGVAVYPADGRCFDELYQHADQAQYSAKHLGRSRYVFYNKELDDRGGGRVHAEEPRAERSPADAPREEGERRHSLLVVDDQKVNRAILKEIFQKDYEVLEAAGGREALTILRGAQKTISAMILDLLMPDLSGLDVLKEMGRDAYYQSIPVVVVSAADEGEYGVKAIELGAVDFVTKPIDEKLVLMRVRNAIFRRESENLRAQNRDLLVQRADEARHQNQLRYLADHDSLTHICNKNAFYSKTRDMIRRRADVRFCIVSFDVQRFRAVNDIFGHEEGDRLLRFIAMQLRNLIGQDGTYTRADTDNFAFCVAYRQQRVEDMMQSLIDAVRGYDLSFEVLLSFGVYVVEDDELPVNQMYDRSEMAKRTVKGSYVRRWAYYDAHMRATLLEEQEIVSSMNAALDSGEFVVYYQPKCMLDTGMVVGAEALARWNHKTRGLLPPGVFIPIFEKNGFIMRLDIYVWERVCAFLSERLKKDPDDRLRVSVNISRANLYNPNLARTLDELCRKYGVPNERMEVEITESAYVESAHLLLGLTDELHRLGFTVEMDDFGSGYSSLNMLKEIPVDVLKLDMRFLYGIQSDDRGGSILSSTVAMARQLRLRVIAEGVENEEQARFLAAIGCKQAQGFYYAKPMPQSDFARLYDAQPTLAGARQMTLSEADAEIGRLLCAAVVLRRERGELWLHGANEYYLRMMRIDRETFDNTDRKLGNWLGDEDARILFATLDTARDAQSDCPCTCLERDLRDRFHLLRALARHLFTEGEREYYLVTFTDISDGQEP